MNDIFYSCIYDILYDRSKHNKLLSINDLKDIVKIYNKRYLTQDYVNGVIRVSFDNPKQFGGYTFKSKLIKVDDMKICKNTNFEGIYGMNISILQTLLHELSHAYQVKKFNEYKTPNYNYTDIEMYLLLYSFFYLKYTDKDRRLGEKDIEILSKLGLNPNSPTLCTDVKNTLNSYYRYNPSERMAEIKALSSIKFMLSLFDNKWDQIEKVDSLLAGEYIRGYNKGEKDLCYNSPSITYFRSLKLKEEINLLNDLIYTYKDDLNDTKRLYLGIHTDNSIIKKLKDKNKSGK